MRMQMEKKLYETAIDKLLVQNVLLWWGVGGSW